MYTCTGYDVLQSPEYLYVVYSVLRSIYIDCTDKPTCTTFVSRLPTMVVYVVCLIAVLNPRYKTTLYYTILFSLVF